MIMKIITICGSLKYMSDMMVMAETLSLEGNCVLTPTYPVIEDLDITDKEIKIFREAHFKRIELSDAIFVFNKDHYIGEATSMEIDYAKSLNKEIIYYEEDSMKKVQKAGCILVDVDCKMVALVYREEKQDYSFPKGHMEEGESLIDCAIRETAEETKRDCALILEDAIATNSYITPRGEDVVVYYYLTKDIGKSDNQSIETHPIVWVPINEVSNKLSYDNLRDMWDSIKEQVELLCFQ